MAKIEKFEDMDLWKNARTLIQLIYKKTSTKEFSRDYGLKDQIQRAAVSIMSNIAEGFERGGNKEFQQFLWVSKASAAEVRSLLYVAVDLNYISQNEFNEVMDLSISISRQISGFIKYLQDSEFQGQKKKQ